jgi:plasmid stabilization system protein ParE
MPRLIWLPEALRDLDRLIVFINGKNPEAARRAAQVIGTGAGQLQTTPELGRPMADGTHRRELIIPFGAGAYVLRYRLDGDQAVVIIRVWHGREDRV